MEPTITGGIQSPYLTKRQAANLLGVTTRYIERAVATGRLCAYRPTRKLWRVKQADLDAFMQGGATIGGQQ